MKKRSLGHFAEELLGINSAPHFGAAAQQKNDATKQGE
jgi:hypothetical protein